MWLQIFKKNYLPKFESEKITVSYISQIVYSYLLDPQNQSKNSTGLNQKKNPTIYDAKHLNPVDFWSITDKWLTSLFLSHKIAK